MGMSVGQGSGKKQRATPSVNITPLVDVALVVLIIFMVVTPLATKTFWLNIPKESDPNAPKAELSDKPVVMRVSKSGEIKLGNETITREQIKTEVPSKLAATKHKVLHFDAADDAPYGVAVEVLDLSRAAGAKSIAIVTKGLSH